MITGQRCKKLTRKRRKICLHILRCRFHQHSHCGAQDNQFYRMLIRGTRKSNTGLCALICLAGTGLNDVGQVLQQLCQVLQVCCHQCSLDRFGHIGFSRRISWGLIFHRKVFEEKYGVWSVGDPRFSICSSFQQPNGQTFSKCYHLQLSLPLGQDVT